MSNLVRQPSSSDSPLAIAASTRRNLGGQWMSLHGIQAVSLSIGILGQTMTISALTSSVSSCGLSLRRHAGLVALMVLV